MKTCDTSCPVCSYILISDEISSTTTQEKFPIDGSFSCKTSGTVYVITCTKCSKQYVGQTGSQLKERILDHLQFIDENEELTGEHFNLPDHSHSDMKVQIVEKIRPNSEENRRGREEFWIEKISTKAPHGLNKNDWKCFTLKNILWIILNLSLITKTLLINNCNSKMKLSYVHFPHVPDVRTEHGRI